MHAQAKGERNYHIFYAMCAGLTEKEKLELHVTRAVDYRYLCGGLYSSSAATASRPSSSMSSSSQQSTGGAGTLHPLVPANADPASGLDEQLNVEKRDESVEWANIRAAMRVLTFTDDEIWQIMRLLAALLHIGNVKSTGTSRVPSDRLTSCSVPCCFVIEYTVDSCTLHFTLYLNEHCLYYRTRVLLTVCSYRIDRFV